MSDLPDLSKPFPVTDVPQGGMLHGTVGDQEVVVVGATGGLHAVSATCSHYGGPLQEGIFDGLCVRCPWHHAAFDAATGRADRGPAITAVTAFTVEVDGDTARIVGEEDVPADTPQADTPGRIIVVGGGPAAHAFVHRLVTRGYPGSLLVVSAESGRPVDRVNVSKDYLAGEAEEAWMPLPGGGVYDEDTVTYMDGTTVESLDLATRSITLADGSQHTADLVVLATGAEPRRLPGDDGSIRYLRTQADADAIVEALPGSDATVVVIGASFIGLEAASALRHRGAEVHVVAPEDAPMASILGPDVSARIVAEHCRAGVELHLGQQVDRVSTNLVVLADGTELPADVVVAGIGVIPRTDLLVDAAGTDGLPEGADGIIVDEQYRVLDSTGSPLAGMMAIGDVARRPTRDGAIRIEHFSMAIRDGQVAADLVLGLSGAEYGAPFFWTVQHDFSLRYVGHADRPTHFDLEGDLDADDAIVRIWQDGRLAAAITVGRDRAALKVGLELEQSR